MSIPSIIPITSPIPSFQPTVMQKDLIAGTSIQIGGLEIEGFSLLFKKIHTLLHLEIKIKRTIVFLGHMVLQTHGIILQQIQNNTTRS